MKPLKDYIPTEVFSKTFKPPVTNGSGNPRKNLRYAKQILEEEGWFVGGVEPPPLSMEPRKYFVISDLSLRYR